MINIASIKDITSIESEAGIIASLIHHPEFSFYSEQLLPTHFFNKENRCVYTAICELAKKGIENIDPFNIIEILNSDEATRKYAEDLTVEKLQELMDMSDVIARNTVEEYKVLVSNVLDSAFRRYTFSRLQDCQNLCLDRKQTNVEQKIYNTIDEVMTEFSTVEDTPQYKDVIDGFWEEIKRRRSKGFAGIPFKFKTLNEYATIEPGELFIFGAEAKQGKSIMLLNCAIDLLKKGYSVLYLDSELNTRLFTARVLSHLSGIEYKKLVSGTYPEEDEKKIEEAIAWMKTRKFTHIYIPMFDQQSIYTAVKRVKHSVGLDVLIVDK